ncbi:PHPT1 [Symbiodinium microadriaticum]|nr:PHPT1 [Symbiodinium microadriaticum]
MAEEVGPTTNAADQEKASGLRDAGAGPVGAASADAKVLERFQACDVASGVFKYVQVHAIAPDGTRKVIVRSAPGSYHADVAELLCQALRDKGLQYEIPGGGRIRRDDEAKEIEIYGHSKGFGMPDHSISAAICRASFPDYKAKQEEQVTHRNTGY